MSRARRTGWLAALCLLVSACGVPAATSGTPLADLERVRVVADRPDIAGYDRLCSRGRGCSFGPAWTDDVDVAVGHDGCDQRSGVLRRDLRDVAVKSGTHGCVVLSGVLDDPYTGATVAYRRGEAPPAVVVDHVVSLSAAWDLGAAGWDLQHRKDLAGDPRNLITTTRAANLSKGDKTPGEWMPAQGRCRFAAAYVDVALAYDLPITRADRRTLRHALQRC